MARIVDYFKRTSELAASKVEEIYFYGLNLFSGGSGYKVIPKKKLVDNAYGCNPFVANIVNKISGVVSRLPYAFYDKNRDVVDSSAEADLWSMPSAGLFGDEFRQMLITDLEVTGEAFVYGVSSTGFGDKYESFEILKSKYVEQVFDSSGTELVAIKYRYGSGKERIIEDIDNVLVIKFPSVASNKDVGLSPLQASWSVVEASTAIFNAEKSIFKNRGVSEILTNDSDMPMLSSEQQRVQDSFQDDNSGVDKFGKILVTNAKLRRLQMGMSPQDMELLKSSIAKLRIIASTYGLSSDVFNDPENSTYNNRTEANKAAYRDVYLPLAENKICKSFNKWWLSDNWRSDLRLGVDISKIDVLNNIEKDLSDKLVNEVNAGIITASEANEKMYGERR